MQIMRVWWVGRSTDLGMQVSGPAGACQPHPCWVTLGKSPKNFLRCCYSEGLGIVGLYDLFHREHSYDHVEL